MQGVVPGTPMAGKVAERDIKYIPRMFQFHQRSQRLSSVFVSEFPTFCPLSQHCP